MSIDEGQAKPGVALGTYRHYKGKLYRVIGTATHEATGARMVVYQHVETNNPNEIWVRPMDEFVAEITDKDTGNKFKRFEYQG